MVEIHDFHFVIDPKITGFPFSIFEDEIYGVCYSQRNPEITKSQNQKSQNPSISNLS